MAVAATEAPAPRGPYDTPGLPEDLMLVAYRLEAEAVVIRRLCAGLREDRRRREASEGSLRRTEPPPPREKIGDQVREARLRLRLSQRELGEELGLSRGIVADAELGRRSTPPLLGAWAKRVLNGGGGR